MKIAILASGRGTNMEALLDAVDEGEIKAAVGLVFSDKKEAPALEIARSRGIRTLALDSTDFPSREAFDQKTVSLLREENIDIVCLAGYMRILSPFFIKSYQGKILNIHPSLLPAFPGLNAQKQAWDYGVKVTGATVHLVDEGLDSGPILIQETVEIHEEESLESLSSRILEAEHRIYRSALKALVDGRISIEGRRVFFKKEASRS